jgi:hypothetical protein
MDNVDIVNSKEEKDLGVFIDEDLKFHTHVAYAVKKANRMLGCVKHTFTTLDEETLPLLYKSLVRSHLEYGNVIWHPRYKMDELEVEKVQRRVTKLLIVSWLEEEEYSTRCRVLKLPTLSYRRRRGDMIQVYKILSGIDRIDPVEVFEFLKTDISRGHTRKLYKSKFGSELRRNTFSCRVVDDWNSLPEDIVMANTVNQFKNRLDKHWSSLRYVQP